jgi:hypothetical protein
MFSGGSKAGGGSFGSKSAGRAGGRGSGGAAESTTGLFGMPAPGPLGSPPDHIFAATTQQSPGMGKR